MEEGPGKANIVVKQRRTSKGVGCAAGRQGGGPQRSRAANMTDDDESSAFARHQAPARIIAARRRHLQLTMRKDPRRTICLGFASSSVAAAADHACLAETI